MKATFNGTCSKCSQFKPACAMVFLRRDGIASLYHPIPVPMCFTCRKDNSGRYRLEDKHKTGDR